MYENEALKQRIADAEKQEPVAYLNLFAWKYAGYNTVFATPERAMDNQDALYTRPPIPPDVAELKDKLQGSHAELLAIHKIGMCIAECPPIHATDTMTVKMVKEMVIRINGIYELQQKLAASEADVNMLCDALNSRSVIGCVQGYNRLLHNFQRSVTDIPAFTLNMDKVNKALTAVRARKEG